MMRKLRVLYLLLAVCAGQGLARAGEVPADVRDLQQKFQAYLQDILTTHNSKLAVLDAAASADKVAELAQAKNRAILNSAQKYDALLAEREKRAAGDASVALAIKEERHRAMQDPVVTAAEFELAMSGDQDVTQAPEEDAALRAPETNNTGSADNAPSELPAAPSTDIVAPINPNGTKVKVYPPENKVPFADSAFKKIVLSRTENSPMGRTVAVAALVMAESDVRRLDGMPRRQEILERWNLRLQLRVLPVAGELQKLAVYVQPYIKSAQAQGPVSPVLVDVIRVDLAQVSTGTTTIDLPAVESTKLRARAGRNAWQEWGKEFYGVVISVFDATPTLLYQGVSVRGLLSEASAEPPSNPLHAQP